PVIPMAVDHFRWAGRAGQWDQHWLFEELARRRDAFILLDEVAEPGHALHLAWRDLTSEASTFGLERMGRGGDVASLLHRIRSEAPAAEAFLNAERVALWDERLHESPKTWFRWVWFLCWGAFVLIRCTSIFEGPTPTPSTVPVPVLHERLTDPVVDLNPTLSR